MIAVDAVHQTGHVRLPADRFYWARLDASKLGDSRRPNRRSLGYLFESVLPIPIEDVHSSYKQIDADTFIACGIQRCDLDELRAGGAITVAPIEVPSFLDCDADPARMNLLTGPFAPPKLRRMQRQFLSMTAVLLVILAALLMVGTERRIDVLQAQSAILDQQQTDVAQTVLGEDTTDRSLPVSLQLTALVRELRSTRNVQTGPVESPDAAIALSELLTKWPSTVEAQTNSISIAPQMITIQASVASAESVQALADALQPMPNWELQQPRVNSSREAVRTTIQLVRHTNNDVEESR